MRSTTRGEGQIKLIFTLALIGATFFVGYKFIPVKMANSKLHDRVIEEAKFAGADARRTADVIRANIWETAVEAGLDDYFDQKDIKVDRSSNKVKIYIYYERPVKLASYVYTWKFEIQEDRAIY